MSWNCDLTPSQSPRCKIPPRYKTRALAGLSFHNHSPEGPDPKADPYNFLLKDFQSRTPNPCSGVLCDAMVHETGLQIGMVCDELG